MQRPIENCYWVAPGKLLAGECPRDLDNESSATRVAALKQAGVDLFVDLTEDGELLPYAQWTAPARHERFSIRDVSVPRSHEYAAATLDAIDAHVEAGGTVYVQCRGGIGRTDVIRRTTPSRPGSAASALPRTTDSRSSSRKHILPPRDRPPIAGAAVEKRGRSATNREIVRTPATRNAGRRGPAHGRKRKRPGQNRTRR